jgi:hypothetical protein
MAYEFDSYDIIKSHVDRLTDQLYTSLPATVTKYNTSKQSVDVSIDIRQPKTLSREEMPTMGLTEVPIIFPSGGGGILSFPIKTGDKVLLCFSMMSLDKWKEKGAGVCGDSRMHSNSDAVAIAGLFNLSSNLDPNADDVELKAFGSTVTLLSSGDIQLKPAGKTIVDSDLDVTGDINCSKTVTGATDCVGGGKSLKGHKHGGVQSGGSQTTPPV